MPWRHMGGEEGKLLIILNLGTRWGWVVSVTPRPRFTPGTHWIGGLVVPRAGLDAGARRKIISPCRGSNPDRPARSQTLCCLSYRGSHYYYKINFYDVTILLILLIVLAYLFNDALSTEEALQDRTICRRWLCIVVIYFAEGCRGLFQYTIPAFIWTDWRERIKIMRIHSNPGKIQTMLDWKSIHLH
jgi:hypothetical protein